MLTPRGCQAALQHVCKIYTSQRINDGVCALLVMLATQKGADDSDVMAGAQRLIETTEKMSSSINLARAIADCIEVKGEFTAGEEPQEEACPMGRLCLGGLIFQLGDDGEEWNFPCPRCRKGAQWKMRYEANHEAYKKNLIDMHGMKAYTAREESKQAAWEKLRERVRDGIINEG